MPKMPIAIPCSLAGNVSRRIACATVMMTPPPMPCSARTATIVGSDRAIPHNIDATVKIARLAR